MVFDRLFAVSSSATLPDEKRKRDLYRRSILDFALDDAQQLRRRLGLNDRRKIDEYLSAVREIEIRIARFASSQAQPPAGAARPSGVPDNLVEHIRLMFDLMVLAFQTDATRICTFMFANEGSNRSYAFINAPEGHHDVSHHGGSVNKQEKIQIINRFHVEQFAYFLGKLKSTREGENNCSLLENMMVVYGSGISDGDRHNHDDLPILLAGRGGGTIKPGRHIKYTPTPLNNLFLSLLDRMGVALERHGDSTGRLEKLDA
jgi:hypothetical protein